MGGHFGTFACQEILADFPEIDSVVRQEAEDTINAIRDGRDFPAFDPDTEGRQVDRSMGAMAAEFATLRAA